MGSTSTFVAKRVPVALLGSCIKPRPRSNSLPLPQLGRNMVVQSRPFYTRVSEFSSATISRELSMFPKVTDFVSSPRPSRLSIIPEGPREIVFLGGAPGAGKGTNSAYISQLRGFDAPTIVVSDLLNTPACKMLKDQGVMINDEFVFDELLKELEKPIYRNGVVVDGFPRTAKQAKFISEYYSQSDSPAVSFVMLNVDENASIKRQQERGKETISFNRRRASVDIPPLEVRATDMLPEASKARYTVFKEQLNAVMELSNQFPLVVVDASSTLEVVRANLASQMASLPTPSSNYVTARFSFS